MAACFVVDPLPAPCSLALAEQLGADVCLNPQASATPAEVGEWLKASLPPYGPDIVIDCAGFQSTLQVSPS